MKAIQVLMEESVLAELDQQAAREGLDRSKLIRAAVIDLLAERRRRALEDAHRRGYERAPQQRDDLGYWEEAQAWPAD